MVLYASLAAILNVAIPGNSTEFTWLHSLLFGSRKVPLDNGLVSIR
jgi:hypothetical protein